MHNWFLFPDNSKFYQVNKINKYNKEQPNIHYEKQNTSDRFYIVFG